MLITLQDDQVIRVYADVNEVIRDIEALDAEEVLRAVFDESGEVYAVKWIRPNTRGRLLRFMVGNGEYTLVPTGRKNVERLLKLLRETGSIEPAEARSALAALQDSLSMQRDRTELNGEGK
jgi:hypothetical protein